MRLKAHRPWRLARHVIVVVAIGFVTTLVFAGPAAADTIEFEGQGTNQDGTCGQFQGTPPEPGGTQTWQFNLTGTEAGATLTASFSDGTSVSNAPEDDHTGNTSKWFIVTDAGASVTSASATFTPSGGGNPQLVVSHCTAGGTKPPSPPSPGGGGEGGGVEVGGATAERPAGAAPAAAVTSQARFTG